jgi:CheY-like chemotaxis protein
MSCPSGRIKATRVLVVDDNENNLLVMANMLCPNGFEVEMARSGEECLSLLSARIGTGNVPDVVLLDVMMGGISGVECCEQIRQYRGMAEHELPVILVTASESDSVMRAGFLAGATDFLQKPLP